MLTYTTLASGSSGNAALISCGQTHILLDAGISARRITTALRQMGVAADQLTAILVTHDHSDHIGGLGVFTKQNHVPIYATAATCATLERKSPHIKPMLRPREIGFTAQLGELWVRSCATPHDTVGSVGYSIAGGGVRMVHCTDLGYVTQEIAQVVQGCDLLVCEANHDEDWVRTGPYTHSLKQRVLGDFGHLSNEAGAELALIAAQNGAREILLAHLSSENNTPAHAMKVVSERLRRAGIDLDHGVRLSTAPRDELGHTCFVERQEAGKC